VHGAAGRADAARDVFAAALDRFEATDDLPAMAGTHMDWAIVEERLGELQRARELYAIAAGLWAGQGLPRGTAWCNVGLIGTLRALGAHDEEADVRDRARATIAMLGDTIGLALLEDAGARDLRAPTSPR
jgi:hypothetical protein